MEAYNIYNILLFLAFSIVVLGIFLGAGKNRNIVVFIDYDDLGLTFLIPVSFLGIFFLFHMFGGNPIWGLILSGIISFTLFLIMLIRSYKDNQKNILKTCLAVFTKLPLAFIWIINLITLINPSGQTARQRRDSRASALLILMFITPIIGLLVVNKVGSAINPKDWIKGRRVGGIRQYM
ncbi:hypothetical protein F966_00884 [Acinetobacter higginsii]|uniref:Uncharacterized protein n=1 Tax=Acinetobacter higginsii TaxID=70347 RepID=N8XPY5_9GAMM|nr:hypothetical protein [Acinetobacter higginsii]ENV11099.1 hypothetical protein F966_00884 [Acinetobacter higginsii]